MSDFPNRAVRLEGLLGLVGIGHLAAHSKARDRPISQLFKEIIRIPPLNDFSFFDSRVATGQPANRA